ncbi:MAG: OsmC family peroxiredoxin [Thiohalomonadaceae bacterium]
MPVRTAEAQWQGGLMQGQGTLRHPADGPAVPYSAAARFADGKGTNPEELIGAAHAGCFSMALAGILEQAGHAPETIKLRTRARVHIDREGPGWRITSIELDTGGEVPGLDEAGFQRHAETAKRDCPVSRALAGTDVHLTARLMKGEAMNFHDFLGQVQHRAQLRSMDEALRATRATLTTLSERLQGQEPFHLGAQLPHEIAEFLKGPTAGGGERFSSDEFFRRVCDKEGVDLPAAVYHARVVLEVLKEAVSPGEIDDVRAQLPPDYQRLFEGASGSMPPV